MNDYKSASSVLNLYLIVFKLYYAFWKPGPKH